MSNLSVSIQPVLVTKEVAAQMLGGISVTTFEEGVRTKKYPQARQISPGRVGWLYSELLEFGAKLPVSEGLPPKNSGHGRAGKPKDSTLSPKARSQCTRSASEVCRL